MFYCFVMPKMFLFVTTLAPIHMPASLPLCLMVTQPLMQELFHCLIIRTKKEDTKIRGTKEEREERIEKTRRFFVQDSLRRAADQVFLSVMEMRAPQVIKFPQKAVANFLRALATFSRTLET